MEAAGLRSSAPGQGCRGSCCTAAVRGCTRGGRGRSGGTHRGRRAQRARNRRAPADCRRERQQRDRGTDLLSRRHGKAARHEYPLEVSGKRPHTRGDDRAEARDYRTVTLKSGLAGRPNCVFRSRPASRTLKTGPLCNDSFRLLRTARRVGAFCSCGCWPEAV